MPRIGAFTTRQTTGRIRSVTTRTSSGLYSYAPRGSVRCCRTAAGPDSRAESVSASINTANLTGGQSKTPSYSLLCAHGVPARRHLCCLRTRSPPASSVTPTNCRSFSNSIISPHAATWVVYSVFLFFILSYLLCCYYLILLSMILLVRPATGLDASNYRRSTLLPRGTSSSVKPLPAIRTISRSGNAAGLRPETNAAAAEILRRDVSRPPRLDDPNQFNHRPTFKLACGNSLSEPFVTAEMN